MKGQKLVINFQGEKAYMSNHKVLNIRNIKLPDFVKNFKAPAALRIEVLNYNSVENEIFAKILSYNTGKLGYPDYQIFQEIEINKIEKIRFKSIDTNAIFSILKGNGESREFIPRIEKIPEREDRGYIHHPSPVQIKQQPLIAMIKETFFIPIKNVHFKSGCISFEKRLAQFNKAIEFTVNNSEIREEFDAIKNYFENVLQTKKIQVDVVIHLSDGKVTSIETKSPEISKIDQSLIDSVKFECVKGLTKIKTENEKFVYTMDEIFNAQSEGRIKASVFYNNESQLLEDLLKITDTKHYNHLRFLSNKHAHLSMKLRFVLKPFSFIFLVIGARNYHIILESLDTEEATYVWHEDKDPNKLEFAINKIENVINTFKLLGKTNYLNQQHSEDNFVRIYHDYTEVTSGFEKWKEQLEHILT